MYFPREMAKAYAEDSKARLAEKKRQEKIAKITALLNDSGATAGEKQAARSALDRLQA